MKLTNNTLEVLKNFSKISPSILFEEGEFLITRNISRTLYGVAKLDQRIENKFAIYDLVQFIAVLEQFKDPDINFIENSASNLSSKSSKVMLDIKEDRRSIKFTPSIPDLIPGADYKKILTTLTNNDLNSIFSFKWTNDQFQKFVKAINVLQLNQVKIYTDNGKVFIKAHSDKNEKSYNTVEEYLCDCEPDLEFSVLIDPTYLKMLPDDYEVKIFDRKAVLFESERVRYFINTTVNTNMVKK